MLRSYLGIRVSLVLTRALFHLW